MEDTNENHPGVLDIIKTVDSNGQRLWSSFWEADEEDIDEFTEEEIANEPPKRILWASENNKVDIVRELLTSDPNLVHSTDGDRYTPLHRAAYSNNVEVAQLLLSHGADFSAQTSDGWQPLHSAARWDNVAIATLLLNAGADVNAQTAGGLTPLHLAASEPDSRDTLELLLNYPFLQPELISAVGETARMVARRSSRHYRMFDMLDDCVNVL